VTLGFEHGGSTVSGIFDDRLTGFPDDGGDGDGFRDLQPAEATGPADRLLNAATEVQVDPIVEVNWVAVNYLSDYDQIRAESVPSKRAVGLLHWVKETPGAEQRFWTDMYRLVLTNKVGDVEGDRFHDDGRLLGLIPGIEDQVPGDAPPHNGHHHPGADGTGPDV
jgi:hypothetical protein